MRKSGTEVRHPHRHRSTRHRLRSRTQETGSRYDVYDPRYRPLCELTYAHSGVDRIIVFGVVKWEYFLSNIEGTP